MARLAFNAAFCAVALLALIAGATSRRTSGIDGSRRHLLQAASSFRTCTQLITGLQVVFKGEGNYETLRQRVSNPYFLSFKYPAAFGFPATANQAAKLLSCAVQNGIKVAARGGGHNYEGLSSVNGGLVIDMGTMTSIKVSNLNGQDVATVGAGQRIGPLNAALWQSNKFVPTGVCDSVGIVGVTLGGGIGPTVRKAGITADSLVQAQVVTAAGKVLMCNSTSNSDLFFALRGGGGNYGLVTSVTYRLSTPPPKMSVLQVRWDSSQSNMRDLLNAFFSWQPSNLPNEYSYVELFLGVGAVRLVVYYFGPLQDLQNLYNTAPIYRVGTGKTLEQLKEMTYNTFLEYMMNPWNNIPLSQLTLDNVINRAFDNNGARSAYKASSAFLGTGLDAAAVDRLASAVWQRNDKAWVQIHPLSGAVSAIAPTATAFPHRAAKYQLQIYINEYNEAWIQSVQSALKPAATGLQYLNYIDTDTVNPWDTYFGPNAARLKQIKLKYDPNNVFDVLSQR